MGYRLLIPLEQIIEMTGEMEHLNRLVVRIIEAKGGFTCQEDFNLVVHPLLDDLQRYLEENLKSEMSQDILKALVHDWIEQKKTDLESSQKRGEEGV